VLKEFGFQTIPELIKINKWRFTQADFGPVTAIQKYVRSKTDLPKAADFRKKLARSGGISVQDDLLRPRVVGGIGARTLNGILIHGPLSRHPRAVEFGEMGFACFAFPFDDYSDWAAVLDIDRLAEACQIQVKSLEQDGGTRKGEIVRPTWKSRPERAE
jgi:hypothetical protein